MRYSRQHAIDLLSGYIDLVSSFDQSDTSLVPYYSGALLSANILLGKLYSIDKLPKAELIKIINSMKCVSVDSYTFDPNIGIEQINGNSPRRKTAYGKYVFCNTTTKNLFEEVGV